MKSFDLVGQPQKDVELPGIGATDGVYGRRTDTEGFYTFAGYTTPATIYRYDVATGTQQQDLAPAEAGLRSRRLRDQAALLPVEGRATTKISVFPVTTKKGAVPDGKRPTILYGYGGFGHLPRRPSSSGSTIIAWTESSAARGPDRRR